MIFGKTINKYYKKYFHMFALGLLTLIIVDYVQLEIPNYIGALIDELKLESTDQAGILEYIVDISIFVLIIIVGRFGWRLLIFGASRKVDYGIRNEMFAHAESLDAEFYSEHKTGGLMAYFTNDLESVRRAVGPGMIMLVDALFLGGLAFYHMFNLDVLLTLFAGIPLLFIAFFGAVMGRKLRNKFKEAQHAFEDLSDFTNENLSGIGVVKAFVKERTEINEFLKANEHAKNKNIDFVRIQAKLQVTITVIVSTVFVVILGYGGYLVNTTAALPAEEQFTIGNLSTFILLFNALVWPMRALGMIINVRSRGKGSLQRIEYILNQEVGVKDSKDVVEVEEIKGNITFKNLTFQYPDAKEPVLENINFSIKQGEMVGVLGKTGSGKTSILDLLLRVYNIDEGQLFLDGIDIMKLPIKQVRNSIGYVPQDGFLFSDSISNNIAFGCRRDEEYFLQIQEAAKLSDVHDNITEFKHGYDTVIGERGVTLSGGQKQRVSIARALIKNPPILILDDSVSAVDTKTEETILSNLRSVRENKTTILIAHRISTIKDADKIILVEDGKVVDVGRHEDLQERSAFYRDLVYRQRLEDEIEVSN
jgi:ATP-binding cassette subfamily B protein